MKGPVTIMSPSLQASIGTKLMNKITEIVDGVRASTGTGTWTSTRTSLLRVALAGLCCAAAGLAQAAAVPFTATVEGTSSIVEVVDPVGPVVRVQTLATGSGTAGLLTYHSGDVLSLATGQGTGSNRFVTAAGDELLGHFTVQMVPGADPSLFDLLGQVTFDGGLGLYAGASGTAAFVGSGQFVSATQALTRFVFRGSVNTVPEPPTGLLVVLAWAAGALVLRKQYTI